MNYTVPVAVVIPLKADLTYTSGLGGEVVVWNKRSVVCLKANGLVGEPRFVLDHLA